MRATIHAQWGYFIVALSDAQNDSEGQEYGYDTFQKASQFAWEQTPHGTAAQYLERARRLACALCGCDARRSCDCFAVAEPIGGWPEGR